MGSGDRSVAFLALGGVAQARRWTVTNTGDGLGVCPDPTHCTLREAVIDAMRGGRHGLLPASATHYMVTAGEIPITVAPLTIEGAGASSSVIDGAARAASST